MVQLIAHRGASADAPENTLSSIKEALRLGVDYVEIDVHLSQDGIPVAIHDATVRRTTNSWIAKRVEDLSLKQIKALDAGSWFSKKFLGETIPTLEEILSLDFGNAGLMIEIKKGNFPPGKIVSAIMQTLDNIPKLPSIALGSLSPEIMSEIQKQVPARLTCMGIVEKAHLLDSFRDKQLKRLAIYYKLLSPRLIQELHEENTEVWAFTVDDSAVARFLLSIHIDGLITNVPRLMLLLNP